jgi:hypothetical protein
LATNTFTTNPDSVQAVQRVRFSRLWWVGLLAIVLSTVANLALRAIALTMSTVSPEFVPLSMPQPTIFFTVLGVLPAVLVFALVGRFVRRPARTYTIIAAIALLISLIPDVMMIVDPTSAPFPGGTVVNVITLMVQHVVAAVIVVWLLTTQAIERLPAGE